MSEDFAPKSTDISEWNRLRWIYLAILWVMFPIRVVFMVPYLIGLGLSKGIDWIDQQTLVRLARHICDKQDVILARVRKERREWRAARQED